MTARHEKAATLARNDDGDNANDAKGVVISDERPTPVCKQIASPDDEYGRIDRQQRKQKA